jgi:Tol biopolymer transport system component
LHKQRSARSNSTTSHVFRNVGDPQLSPDGQWIAYTVSTIDAKEDKSSTHIWMVAYDGKNDRQITFSTDSEGSPRWSPDGSFWRLQSSRSSGKPGVRGSQIWLLDRSGGEAYQLTELKGRLAGYEWSPDSKRLALVIGDPDPDAPDPSATPAPGTPPKPPKPIVIDRYRYKQDVQGYLLSGRHTYLYLYDIAEQETRSLDEEQVGRIFTVVVTRRNEDRFHEQSWRRSRSRSCGPGLCRGLASWCDRESSDQPLTTARTAHVPNGRATASMLPTWKATRRSSALTTWNTCLGGD